MHRMVKFRVRMFANIMERQAVATKRTVKRKGTRGGARDICGSGREAEEEGDGG